MNTRSLILIVIALAIGAYLVFVPPPDEEVAEAVTRDRAQTASVGEQSEVTSSVLTDSEAQTEAAPMPSAEGDAASARVTDSSAADALFAVQSWYVAPPPPPPAPPAPPAAQPSPAVAPPLPFAFMGSYVRQGEATVYVLSQGDRVYDLHVGDDIDENYRFDSATPAELLLTYKPLKQQQALAIGDPK
jgi:hypothetical protein